MRSGVCADASELVNDVIRSLREQQQKTFNLTPELESWLLAAADKPTTPLTKADFTAIRERVRAKNPRRTIEFMETKSDNLIGQCNRIWQTASHLA